MIKKITGLILVLSVTACGGGGGGGGGGGSGGSGSSAPATTSMPPTAFVLQPGVITASYATGSSVAIPINATAQATINGQPFISVTDANNVLQPTADLNTSSNGIYTIVLHTSPSKASGQYTGTVSINACIDAACTKPLGSSPISAQYSIVVTGAQSGVNLSTLTALPGATDWETFQGNAGHTGYVPVTLNPGQFNTRWQWNAPPVANSSTPSITTITVENGLIYLGSADKLFALKEYDASTAWTYDFSNLPFPSINPPAVSAGAVYIAAGQQGSATMWSFNALSGTLNFKSPMSSQWENYLAPTVSNGVVFEDAGTYGGLYAFNTSSGSQLFFTPLQQFDQWTPAVDSNYVYAYIGGQSAYTPAQLNVIDRNTGTVKASILDASYTWEGYSMYTAPVIGAPGSVFAVNLGNTGANSLMDFNINTASIAWSEKGAYTGNPAYSNGTIYAVNHSPFQFEARSEIGGGLLWSWTPPNASDTSFSSDVLLTQNLAFVSTNMFTYAIDLTSHSAVWSYPKTGKLAMSANGVLYIQSAGSLTAINLH